MKHLFLCFLLLITAAEVNAANTVSANFNGTSIAAGRKIWYTSVIKVNGTATYPLTIYLTNQTITSPLFTRSVHDAILVLDPSVATATTVFNGSAWVTTAKPGEPGYYFISGYVDSLTAPLPGNVPVSWSGTFKASRSGVSLNWHMSAAVYTSFNSNLNNIGVKPSKCSSCSHYSNSHDAGTPENYLSYVIGGARGGGGSNYTGGYSGAESVSPSACCSTKICAGATVSMNPMSAGSWNSSNTAVATVNSSGVVTGVTAGTAKISYMITGCPMWQVITVTVNTLPTITASATPALMCAGATLSLNATTSVDGGGHGGCGEGSAVTWAGPGGFSSSSDHPVRTGMTTAMAGVYSVSVTDDYGCTATATKAVIVNKLPTTITVTLNPSPACVGSTVNLNGTVTGGSGYSLLWTGGTSAINYNTTASANITAVTITDAGTYSLSATAPGCSGAVRGTATLPSLRKLPTTFTASVNPSPVCQGSSVTLRATSTGAIGGVYYTWTGPPGGNGITGATSITTAGVTLTTAGNAGVYTVTASVEGCGTTAAYTSPLVVNKLPTVTASVSPGNVCVGGTFSLTGTVTGGSGYTLLWTGGTSTINNSTTTNAYVTAAAPGDAGVYTLTATVPACGTTTGRTNATPLVVSAGPTSTGATNNSPVCAGGTVTFNANSTGATVWSWAGPGGFTSALQNPVVTAAAAGTYSLTLSNPSGGCTSSTVYTTIVSVNAGPSSTGATNSGPVCVGGSVTLNANSTGATAWSWTGPGGFASTLQNPTVTPAASGIYSLTVSNPGSGCTASAVYTTAVTVNSLPTVSAGSGVAICTGASTTLTATGATSYSWGPSTGLSATSGASVSASPSATTTYTVTGTTGGCSSTSTVTVSVNAQPAISASGGATVCNGSSTTLIATGGTTYSWSPSTGLSAASGAIVSASPVSTTTYTVTGTTGGCNNTATVMVSVNAVPTVSAGSGDVICSGSSAALNATGGTTYSWAPSTGLSAATGASVSANPATTTTYTVTGTTGGCSNTAAVTVIVNPLPDAGSITGPGSLCVGGTATLGNCVGTGTWSSGSPSVATVSLVGVVVAVASGTTVITYTVTNSCGTATAMKTITVNAPTAGLTGPSEVSAGTSILLSVTGGTWSSSNVSVATVDATGTVSGVTDGTATISYTMSNSCFSFTVTKVVTVNTTTTIAPITGTMAMCIGNTTTLSSTTPGGTWTSGNTAVATVSSTGMFTGVSAGTAIITYSVLSGTVMAVVTVNDDPSAITGALSVCAGLTTTLTNAEGGGSWSISSGGIATIDASTGVVTAGPSAGTATVTYTLPTGCYTTAVVSVNANPAAIGGAMEVCAGATTTLTDATSGGVWSSNNTATATIGSATGIVTGVSAGTAMMTYTMGTGCIAAATVTVNALPASITGTLTVCQAMTTTLANATSGGTWSSGSTTVATVDASAGVVTGMTAGTAHITYTTGANCSTNVIVTVNGIQPITGITYMCVGTNAALSDATTGGTWSSSNTAIASVGSTSGIVTGNSVGTATISYTLSNGCFRTTSVNVTTMTPITGSPQVCVGLTTALSNATTGGTWMVANTAIASIGTTSGIASGTATGTTNLTYTAGSCRATTVLTVLASPAVITGPTTVCLGSSVTLNDATTGGTWSTASGNIALSGTAASSTTVTAVSPGVATVTYSAGGLGCYRVYNVTVNAAIAPIAGTFTVCPGATTALTNPTSGGTWSTSNTSVAIVSAGGGFVTGVATGTATITYQVGAGCVATTVVTVISSPSDILGPLNVCTGSSVTLSNASGAGTWTSSNTGLATVGGTTGVVTGVVAGMPFITFTLSSTGCKIRVTVTVTAIPNAGTLSGPTAVAVGGTISLTSTGTAGGAWSSSNSNATVGSTGIVTGVSAGSATITYAVTNACGYSGAYKPISIAASRAAAPSSGGSGPSVRNVSDVMPGANMEASASEGVPATGGSTMMQVNGFVTTGNVAQSAGYSTHSIANMADDMNVSATQVFDPLPMNVRVVPNPNKGTFTISGSLGSLGSEVVDVEIRQMLGQLVYKSKVVPQNGAMDQQVQLTGALPNGMYVVSIKGKNEGKVFHFVMVR